MVLIVEGGDRTDAEHGETERHATMQQLAPPARGDQPRSHHDQRRQRPQQTDIENETEVGEFARFETVGLEDVADHHAVDAHAVRLDEIRMPVRRAEGRAPAAAGPAAAAA
jgi:hypothetical protein